MIKRIVCALCILMLVGCQNVSANKQSKETASEQSIEKMEDHTSKGSSEILYLTKPDSGGLGIGFDLYYTAEKTSFIRNGSKFGYFQEPITIKRRVAYNRTTYTIDDTVYRVLENPDPNTSVYWDHYDWYYDRSFFCFYAETNYGTLYRNTNVDSLEVLILKDKQGTEQLLVSEQSVLWNVKQYDIDDFGLLIINDYAVCRANLFSSLFDLHVGRAEEQPISTKDFSDQVYATSSIYLTWEYTRIPGLRYETMIIIDITNNDHYVFSRAYRCMYKLDVEETILLTTHTP